MATFKTAKVTFDNNEYSIHELSVRHRRDILAEFKKDQDASNLAANLVKYGCENFAYVELEAILDEPGSLIDKLSDKIAEISGMGNKEKKTES